MDVVQRQLMRCLETYRCEGCVASIEPEFDPANWIKLYQLSEIHKLTAVVFETLCKNELFCADNSELFLHWKRETMLQAVLQAARTQKIVYISQLLHQNGIAHAVVKGVVCRSLYSRSDIRISGDEDLLINTCDQEACEEILKQAGLVHIPDVGGEEVAHWRDHNTGLHLEVHTQLFSSKRSEDEILNGIFTEQLKHTVSLPLVEGAVQTLDPTYHFVFLVCHALKHFIAGGFGVRMICDVVTFAERYSKEIQHQTVYVILERVRSRKFLDQLLAIGEQWLGFDTKKSGWTYSAQPDYNELLQDSLDAGIYGHSTMSRRHSAGIVLKATEGQTIKSSTISTVFPSREKMQGKYPVLKSKPILLPLCWAHRLGKYAVEVIHQKDKDNSPLESVSLGKKRTEMMIKYGILPKNKKKN